MSSEASHLVKNLNEISEVVRAVRDNADGRIILAPVDFSDHSAIALAFAADMAEAIRAALVVLHVIHDPAEMPGYYTSLVKSKHFERIDDVAEQALLEFMSRASDSQPDCAALRSAESIMVVGLPVSRILEVAEELDPVMVVMGSHGRTGLDNIIIGSKAAQVVQLCRFPVTIVKNPENRS
jgi:nucleotide-binding universal stress UspA family protein